MVVINADGSGQTTVRSCLSARRRRSRAQSPSPSTHSDATEPSRGTERFRCGAPLEGPTDSLIPTGAWGPGAFDNDDAADWAADFEGKDATTGLILLNAALDAVERSGYVEAPDASNAVGAAHVIAALVAPESITTTAYGAAALDWARRSGARADAVLIRAARGALERVISGDSELAELWDEAGDPEWRAEIDRISALLG